MCTLDEGRYWSMFKIKYENVTAQPNILCESYVHEGHGYCRTYMINLKTNAQIVNQVTILTRIHSSKYLWLCNSNTYNFVIYPLRAMKSMCALKYPL